MDLTTVWSPFKLKSSVLILSVSAILNFDRQLLFLCGSISIRKIGVSLETRKFKEFETDMDKLFFFWGLSLDVLNYF